MRGARRGPYVDMVKPGNDADGAPQGGAGAPMFFRGCDPAGAQARVQVRRCGPLPGRTYACIRAGTAPPSACPGRNPGGDGALWAHIFVVSPRNIDILLRALLLDLHPTSPPPHTCLLLR